MNSKNISPNQSIASLILPPPPLSVFSDYNFENKALINFGDINFNNEIQNCFDANLKFYSKKSPVYFISTQDCKAYMQFVHDISLVKYENGLFIDNLWKENEKNDQILRLLFAFYKLYQEYSEICDIYLSNHTSNYNSGDNIQTFQDISKQVDLQLKGNGENFSFKKETCHVGIQTGNDLPRRNCALSKVQNEISISPDNHSLIYGLKTLFKHPFKIGKCLKTGNLSKSSENLLNFRSTVFDKIEDKNIEVVEFERYNCKRIVHKVTLLKSDTSKKYQTIKIPIALELLLPKIQTDIDTILGQCPFLCDPLEVIAELRNCNYDQSKCIRYFKKSKFLRYLYSQNDPEVNELAKTSSCASKHSPCHENENTTVNSIYKHISFSSVCKFPLTEYKSNKSDFINADNLPNNAAFSNIEQEKFLRKFSSISVKLKGVKEIQNGILYDVEYLARQLNKVFDSLRNHMIAVINQCSERLITNDQKIKLLAFSRQVEELKLKLKIEENKRRQVYNRMQEQMGNIRVCCRCRHLSDEENILDYAGEDTLILTTSFNERFEFDKVFQPGVSQSDLYEEFRPLVMSFIDGYNVCFITYGGEASGKTYTLIGDNRDPTQQGIMQRSLVTILTEERLRQRDWEYKISACVVEIYNDNCTDILSGESGIQIYVDHGMETAFQKLKSVPITNEADADVLIQVCTVKRKVARTALNPASSRSHLIILIRLQGCSKIHGENICSFLCLCDLAGFEDIIKAETQTNKVLSKEAGYINRSLTAFNRVFVSLKRQDPNTVCYRDTKLTHLLKPFLTNSGKCALIVTVRNDKRSMGSTHNTLRFGKETRGVTLGKARRQVHISNPNQRTS